MNDFLQWYRIYCAGSSLAIESERLAQEIDSAKDLEVEATNLLETARKIPLGSERHEPHSGPTALGER